MCYAVGAWTWSNHQYKHAVRGKLRDAQRAEIVAATGGGRKALYLPHVDIAHLEANVAQEGVYVECRKPATQYMLKAFDEPIGASDGQLSRWAVIESTSGTFHGRPVTETEYMQMISRPTQCCDEVRDELA